MGEEIVNTNQEGTQESNSQENQENTEQTTSLGDGVQADSQNQEDQKEDQEEDKKQESEKDSGKKEDEGKENELFGKPESYDYKDVKLPEGMQLNEAMTGKFNEYASKLNLSQKGANDLMSMAVELTEQTQKQTVEAMGKLQLQKIEGYKVLLNKDSEVGGAKLKDSLATANIAYDGFFKDEDLRVMIAEAGLNVHPKFIKALKDIGLQMKDDTVFTGGQSGNKQNREDILYSSMEDKK